MRTELERRVPRTPPPIDDELPKEPMTRGVRVGWAIVLVVVFAILGYLAYAAISFVDSYLAAGR